MGILDLLHSYKLRAFAPLEPPNLKAPVIDGNPGTQTCEYCAVLDTLVGSTPAGNSVVITNAPNTLNGFNRVKIEISQVPAGIQAVRFFKKSGAVFGLIGTGTAAAPALWDEGQAIIVTTNPPTENTSGRDNWLALLPRTAKDFQRADVVDLQAMLLRAIGDVVATFHKDGDVIYGGNEQSRGNNVWDFLGGQVILNPFHVKFPAGTVTLTGSGLERVGLMITPKVIADTDDPVLRDPDEGVAWELAQAGAYRLGFDVAWVVDEPGMLVIREFLDGQPKLAQFKTETTEYDKKIAEQIFDISGSFVVENFGFQTAEDPLDSTKFNVKILNGKAYPDGFRVKTIAPQSTVHPKARETAFKNNSVLDSFECPGGIVIGTATGNLNVDGLAVKIQIGNGGEHTVSLSGTTETAATVATQIGNALNAVPTAPGILIATGSDVAGHLVLQAINGKSLKLLTVASDAYTVLGLTPGIYLPGGRRIYQVSEAYVKDVSDLNYPVVIVEQVTHNGLTHIDALANGNVREILGAANSAADAHDGKWDYRLGIDFSKNVNGDVDFTTYGGSEPGSGATYYVAYEYNYTAVKGSRVLVKVTDAQIVKGAEDGQDNLTFTGGTYTKVIDGSAVTGLSGTVRDVHAILRVNNSAGQGQTQYDLYSLLKNSDALAHSASQIDWSAAGAQGQIGTGQPTTGATYYATFTFWKHEVEGDFAAADSYDLYQEIEMAPNDTWILRDCIDFRTSGIMPEPGENPLLDFNYYLSRVDKIVLKSNGDFYAIIGKASKVPVEPSNPANGLVTAKVVVGPYTYSMQQVVVVPTQSMRRTQAGIQQLADDIEKLKYYQAVNAAESAAKENAASAALDAKGIFVDPLTGTGRCDFGFSKNGIEFTASIDADRQVVRLPVSLDARELVVDLENSTNVQRVGRSLCFAFEESLFQSQLRSTQCLAVNPYEFYSWLGILMLDPEQDVFTDIEQRPVLDTNYDDNMAVFAQIEADNAARASQIAWGSWHMAQDSGRDAYYDTYNGWLQNDDPAHWREIGSAGSALAEIRQREGYVYTVVPQRTLVDLGTTVLDRTVVPMMRTKLQDGSPFYVNVEATSMFPSVAYAGSINGILVDLIPTGAYQAGTAYQGKQTVVADASGRFTAKFQMPEGVPVGSVPVKAFAAENPLVSAATATFFSQGYREVRQQSVEGVISTTVRTDVVGVQRQQAYYDPLAQTFMVTSDDGTVYISSVDLYVCEKDANIPLTVEIRRTLNGFPTADVIQTKTLNPSEINADPTGLTRTRFTFDNVVAYGPAEYAIAILANCNSYYVRVCEIGKVASEDGLPVLSQQAGGTLFASPNGSTWVAMPTIDLKFQINKSNFQNNAQIVFHNLTGIEAGLLCAKVTQFLPVGTSLHWSYSLDNGQTYKPFAPLVDTTLGSVATQCSLMVDVTSVGGTFLIVDKIAGVLFLLHELEAYYVSANALFDAGPLDTPPDKVCVYLACNSDGVNGQGARSITPYYTIDNGEHLCELKPPAGFVPTRIDDSFLEYKFETAGEKSVEGASNTTPIVISSAGHSFVENEVLDFENVGGNTAANGRFRVLNVTTDTFELFDPVTGLPVAGNGTWTTGGTFRLAPYTQCRTLTKLTTTNRAISPEHGPVRAIYGNAAA